MSIPRIEIIWQTTKVTPDDWNPCFADSTILVTVYQYPLNNLHKFVIAGADDTMMSLYTSDIDKVQTTIKWLNNLAIVSKQDLLDYGFQYE